MWAKVAAVVMVLAFGSSVAADSFAQTSNPPTSAQQYPHRLTAAELRAIVPNSTVYTIGKFGPKTFSIYRSAGGRIHMKSPDFEDFGIYRITDDGLLCTKYQKARGGEETCQVLLQTGPDAFEAHLPNGQIIKGAAPVPGNPERL